MLLLQGTIAPEYQKYVTKSANATEKSASTADGKEGEGKSKEKEEAVTKEKNDAAKAKLVLSDNWDDISYEEFVIDYEKEGTKVDVNQEGKPPATTKGKKEEKRPAEKLVDGVSTKKRKRYETSIKQKYKKLRKFAGEAIQKIGMMMSLEESDFSDDESYKSD